jgi:cytochrome bd ubiquinol oxidase subunit II
MLTLENLVAFVMMVSLTFYVLLAGADYGGGVWDLLARGPRAAKQRDLVAHAIGPIWEANHVWLILVVVMLFTAFPSAFALISTSLHIPLVLMLIGIILRGSAFTFRSYDTGEIGQRWGRTFAIASLATPILLGIVVGAISSKAGMSSFFGWIGPFPFAVGLFALVLFAFVAAVYLTLETDDPKLQDDFRRRAIACELVAGVLALLVFLLSGAGAPEIRQRLAGSWWTWPLQLSTGLFALATLTSLWLRKYPVARVCAAGQVTLILWGWALAQYPFLVRPDVTILNSAAPEAVLRMLLWALAAGALLLLPSYWYLFRIFKAKI